MLGFLACAWVSTMVGVGYTLWRYAYMPFKATRADCAALQAALVDEIGARKALEVMVNREFGLRKMMNLSDEEVARAEQRHMARIRVNGSDM